MAIERTLVLVKPDAMAVDGMKDKVMDYFRHAGLTVRRSKTVIPALDKLERHYAEHEGKSFYEPLIDFMLCGQIYAAELEGESAQALARNLLGDTQDAAEGTIRGDLRPHQELGPDNLVHASDSPEAAEREIGIWFDPYPYTVLMWVLPGGKVPVRKTGGAVALDAHSRAIIHPEVKDPDDERWRLTLFNFRDRPTDRRALGHVVPVPTEDGQGSVWAYRVPPREQALVGVGFATAMSRRMWYWLTPRSGLASVYAVTNSNAPGTVDSDYRGEAGVGLINHGHADFDILHQDRIIQVMFQPNPHPEIILVDTYEELGGTVRGAGGFGSTGVRG